ncbi:MAG TPA: DUF1513 domain-containing protein [Burkholderiaceae bacterium]|nr:DUF1513 domain-containing protein [Burkholderiaceae bacterium]
MKNLTRQNFLRTTSLGLVAMAIAPHTWAVSAAAKQSPQTRIGAAWRRAVSATNAQDYVGVMELDWDKQKIQVQTEHAVPTRAHGLMAEASGGFLAIAARPGTWIRRFGPAGELVQHLSIESESPSRTLAGHILYSQDGNWLYTTESDGKTQAGWVSVRNAKTLKKVAEWRSHGRDPHQCLLDSSGALMLVNGGILRDQNGQKRDLDQMNASLVRMDGRTGELLGRWHVNDNRLSLRHMAWNHAPAGSQALLGIAMQAEHDDVRTRRNAPVLALWDGKQITIPCNDAIAAGYAGDIAAGPGGGFILSGQHASKGVMWHPDEPEKLFTIAELKNICALTIMDDVEKDKTVSKSVIMGSELGVAYWNPHHKPLMMGWPTALTLDNHWVILS